MTLSNSISPSDQTNTPAQKRATPRILGLGLLDLTLPVVCLVMVAANEVPLFFRVLFILLTIGAFFWQPRGFLVRTCLWLALSSAIMLGHVSAGRISQGELIEIPLAIITLGLVFIIANRRTRVEKELSSIARLSAENPDPILRVTPDGNILYRNLAASQMVTTSQNQVPEDCRVQVAHAFQSNERTEVELVIDGRVFACVLVPVIAAGYVNIYGEDVTERKQAEQALQKSETGYRTIFENTGTAVMVIEESTIISLINTEFEKLSGYSKAEVEGKKSWTEFVAPEDLEPMLAQHRLRRSNPASARKNYEFRFVDRSGEISHACLFIELIPGTRQSIASVVDLTERVHAEQGLIEERSLLRALIESMPDMIYVKDTEGRFLIVNETVARELATTSNQLIGKTDYDFHPAELAAQYQRDEQAILTSGQAIINQEESYIDPNGIPRWLSTTKVPFRDRQGKIKGIVGINRDITERKRTEQVLADERRLLRTLIDLLPDPIYVKDAQGRFLVANESVARVMGTTPNELIGKGDLDFYPRDLAEQYSADEQTLLKSGQSLINKEEPRIDPDGTTHWVLTSKVPFRDSQGNIAGLVGTGRDITRRKRTEQIIAEERGLLRTLIDIIPGPVYIKDTQSRFLVANEKVARIMGTTPDQLIGKTDLDFYPKELAEQFLADERRIIESGQPMIDQEEPCLDQDGKTFWLSTTKIPFRDSQGNIKGIVGVGYDYTERRRAAEELRRKNAALANANSLSTNMMRQLTRQLRQTTLLNRVISAATSALESEVILQVVCEELAKGLKVPQVRAALFTDAGQYLTITAESKRPEAPSALGTMIPTADNLAIQYVLEHRAPLVINNQPTDSRMESLRESMAQQQITSMVFVPLQSPDRIMGTISLESFEPHEFNDDEITLIQNAAAAAGQALDNSRLFTSAQKELAERKQAEAALRESEMRFRELFDASPDAVLLINPNLPNWPIVDCNQMACQMNGYTRKELIGQSIDILHATLAVPGERDASLARLHRKGTLHYETMHVRKDGTHFPIEVSTKLIGTPGKELILGIDRDITERKHIDAELRQQRDFAQQVMTTMGQGLVVTDDQDRFEFVNPAFAKMLGYTPEKLIGELATSVVYPPDLALLEQSYKQRAAGETNTYEMRLKRADGNPLHGLVTGTPRWRDRSSIAAISVISNLTERKQMEDALAQARDQAMAASRLKSEFLATMSHEIRTPMNSIIGMSEMLLSTPLDAQQRDLATVIDQSGHALLAIINDILDFSKIEAGKFVLENIDFDIATTMEGTVDLLTPKAREKKLALMAYVSPEIPLWLRGDPGRLRQILLNLVGNAVKFTHAGEIVVRVDLLERTHTDITLRFSVKDTGIGLSEEARQRLFQPFTQADGSTTRKYGGTGLGLAICKRLTELMQGNIGVESEPGHGSTFWFTAHFVPALVKTVAKANVQGLRTLIVDDIKSHRDIVQSYLSSWGIRARGAENGEQALQLLKEAAAAEKPFDLAILDLRMPDIDGLALARTIRQDTALQSTRLILLTGFDEKGQGEQALDAGFSAYLTKPVKQSHLYDAIANVTVSTPHKPEPAPQPARLPPAPVPTATQSTKRVLLAEDNLINQKVAKLQLAKLGFAVETVVNGREAIAAVLNNPDQFVAVLMDCQMPEMDGFAATHAIRKNELTSGRHIPIIAMTANALEGDRERCLAAGMDDYISKPVSIDNLNTVLQRWSPKNGA